MRSKYNPTPKTIPIFNHEKLLSRICINPDTGCWNWTGSICTSGYGKIYINGSKSTNVYKVHRLSFSIFNKYISQDLVIDHICRNRKCCNPDHLREVTNKENVLFNSESRTAINKQKTHCKNGHEFTIENTTIQKSGRSCKVCKSRSARSQVTKDKMKDYYQKNREKILEKRGIYRGREQQKRDK